MAKILEFIQAIMALIKAVFGRKAVTNGRLTKLRAGLDAADQKDPDVIRAKARIVEIELKPEREREDYEKEIRRVEELIVNTVKPAPVSGDEADRLIDLFEKEKNQ